MSYQISVIYRAKSFSNCNRQFLPSTVGHQRIVGKVKFLPSALGHQRNMCENQLLPSSLGYRREDTVYRALSVNEGNKEDSVHRVLSVNKGKMEKSASTELTRSSKENWWSQFSPSSLGPQRKHSAYRVHSATEGFHGILCINRALSVNTGIIFWSEFTVLGRPVKGFINICISADWCKELFSKSFEPTE